jgi:hypothetical protein
MPSSTSADGAGPPYRAAMRATVDGGFDAVVAAGEEQQRRAHRNRPSTGCAWFQVHALSFIDLKSGRGPIPDTRRLRTSSRMGGPGKLVQGKGGGMRQRHITCLAPAPMFPIAGLPMHGPGRRRSRNPKMGRRHAPKALTAPINTNALANFDPRSQLAAPTTRPWNGLTRMGGFFFELPENHVFAGTAA